MFKSGIIICHIILYIRYEQNIISYILCYGYFHKYSNSPVLWPQLHHLDQQTTMKERDLSEEDSDMFFQSLHSNLIYDQLVQLSIVLQLLNSLLTRLMQRYDRLDVDV